MYQYKTLSNGIKVVAEKIDYLKSISIGVWVGNGSRYENKEVNGIAPESFDMMIGNIIDDKAIQDQAGYECYDIAVANILAPVIIMLQGEICKHIKHGGMFITSGIINTKEQDVKDAMNANPELEIVETTYQGDWVSITARRK